MNIAESDCAYGQKEQPKEQFECTDAMYKVQLLAVCYEQFGHLYTNLLVQRL
jgi:hypothetical protein